MTTMSELASRHSVYAVTNDPGHSTDDSPVIRTSLRGDDHYEYKQNESTLSYLELVDNTRNQIRPTTPAEYNRLKNSVQSLATGSRLKPKPSIFSLEDKISLFPPGTFSPDPVRGADELVPVSINPPAANVSSYTPVSPRAFRAAASIPHTALQSVVETSISRKPVNDGSTLDPSSVGLALSVYSDTQNIATLDPPENDDLSYIFHEFNLRHSSFAYPGIVAGSGNSYLGNVAHSTLEADMNLTAEQRNRAENNKKRNLAEPSSIAGAEAGNNISDDATVDDGPSHSISSERGDIDAYATYEIENALRIRGARMAHTPATRPDKECLTKVVVSKP